MIYRYMEMGGLLMWPLMFCSFLLLALMIERAWRLGWALSGRGKKLGAYQLTWHRRPLELLAEVAPAMGLLGTVLGLVQSFNLSAGRISGEAVGAGLGTACMTTIFGLIIAILATVTKYTVDMIVEPHLPASQPTPKASSDGKSA
jgi:biopolymer transport protein ExbB